MFDIEINYFLKKTKRGLLILIKSSDGYNHGEIPVTLTKRTNNLELVAIKLKDYWFQYRLYNGLPEFRGPGIISRELFQKTLSEIKNEATVKALRAEKNRTLFIDYLKAKGLEPIPSGGNQYSWYAKCPFSRGKHFMMVSTLRDTFGCGYCGKRGDYRLLQNYFS